MNLVYFSVKTKGLHTFIRRLWTVFTRFGISETKTTQALYIIVNCLQRYNAAPTFYIPAIVLNRHAKLIIEIARLGAEIGVHGYVHNDYRTLSVGEQYEQTEKAITIFEKAHITFQGFRNPYLGWTEDSLRVFTSLGFLYESNEAAFHDIVDLNVVPPLLRDSYAKSLELFQAVPCNAYTLRPHFEGGLLRIPTSIPDDEMLFDRLRLSAEEVGSIWSKVMQRVYDLGGLYVLNLHPERAVACKKALNKLLSYANNQPLPVWLTRLQDIVQWWKERQQFRLSIKAISPGCWQIEANCTDRATLLARHVVIEGLSVPTWHGTDVWVQQQTFTLQSSRCPCLGLSLQTPQEVADFCQEQGYPTRYCTAEEVDRYALYIDLPEGWGATRKEQVQRRSTLIEQIEQTDAPFLHFGAWPDGKRAALGVTGDIDSVTIQDFFLRILEVRRHA